jgi:hypothetical protein
LVPFSLEFLSDCLRAGVGPVLRFLFYCETWGGALVGWLWEGERVPDDLRPSVECVAAVPGGTKGRNPPGGGLEMPDQRILWQLFR